MNHSRSAPSWSGIMLLASRSASAALSISANGDQATDRASKGFKITSLGCPKPRSASPPMSVMMTGWRRHRRVPSVP